MASVLFSLRKSVAWGVLASALGCSQAGGGRVTECSGHGTNTGAASTAPACRCEPAWTGPSCETAVSVVAGPTIEASGPKAFASIAASRDGRGLATTDRTVFAVGGREAGQTVFAAPPDSRVQLDPSGLRFGVSVPHGFEVRDRSGNLLLSLPNDAGEYFRLVPESDRVLVAIPDLRDRDDRPVHRLRIVGGSGQTVAEIAAPNVKVTRPTRDAIFYSTSTELVRLSTDGAPAWRIPVRLDRFEVSDDSSLVVALGGRERVRVVLHYSDKGELLGSQDISEGVWNLAASPSGTFSVATTKNRIWLFQRGTVERTIDVPVRYLVSTAVSDRGEVLVGAQNADQHACAYLFDAWGNRLWERVTNDDETQAFRPEVKFLPDASGYIVREKQKVLSFSLAQGRAR